MSGSIETPIVMEASSSSGPIESRRMDGLMEVSMEASQSIKRLHLWKLLHQLNLLGYQSHDRFSTKASTLKSFIATSFYFYTKPIYISIILTTNQSTSGHYAKGSPYTKLKLMKNKYRCGIKVWTLWRSDMSRDLCVCSL